MKEWTCEHEFENANCTNCANGLPSSAYECAKTKGNLKEYCHNRAEEIHQQIREDERNKVIAKIRVGLGRFKTFEIDTEDMHKEIKYYDANMVQSLLSNIANEELTF